MPWESRITDEKRRRIVLAALMLALLGGSTALAMLLTRDRNPRSPAYWQDEKLGSFEIRRPANWRMTTQSEPSGLVVALEDPSSLQREISIRLINIGRPIDPLAIVDNWLDKNAHLQLKGHRAFRLGPAVGHYATGYMHVRHGSTQIIQGQIILDVTLDGRTHLLLHLTQPGTTQADVQTLIDIVRTLRDTRFVAERQSIELGEATVSIPEHLVAWRPTDESLTGRYDLTPDGAGPWAKARFVRLSPRRLNLAQLLPEALAEWGDDAEHAEQLEAIRAAFEGLDDPEELIRGLLWMMPRQVSTHQDPSQLYAVSELAGKTVHTMILEDGTRSPLFRAVWVVRGPEKVVVLMELLASRKEIPTALQAARSVVEQLHWTVQENRDQETQP